jgi:salicylate synthetase
MPSITNTSIQLVPRKTVENHDHLEAVVSLLTKYNNRDYFAYERGDVWHVGLGSYASLRINPSGEVALIKRQDKEEVIPITGSLDDVARNFASEFEQNVKMFGHVGFNYGAHVRGQSYLPGRWDLLRSVGILYA